MVRPGDIKGCGEDKRRCSELRLEEDRVQVQGGGNSV